MDDLVQRLRSVDWLYQDPSNGRGYFSDAPHDAADRIEALTARLAKAEALAEALDLAEDTLRRVAMHHPDTPGLHYDSERSLLDSVTGIATQPLEYIRAALRAWEDTDAPR